MTALKQLVESLVSQVLGENDYSDKRGHPDFPSFEQWLEDSDSTLLDPDTDESEVFELEERFDEWTRKYEDFGNPETLYRCLSVPNIESIDFSKLGRYWTDISTHSSCYLSKDESIAKFVVAVAVPLMVVDWPATLEANMSSFVDESEVTLRDGMKVKVLYVEGEDGKRHRSPEPIGVI